MIFKAIEIAAKAHDGQYRKGSKIPYITHLINTGNLLIEADARDEVVAAGILHDIIEDTMTDIETVRNEFGDEVSKMVLAVSELPKNKYDWKERKIDFINRIKTLSEEEAGIVCADKYDNLFSTSKDLKGIDLHDIERKKKIFKKFNASYEEIKWFYLTLLEELEKLSYVNDKFNFILAGISQISTMMFKHYDEKFEKYGDIAGKIYSSLSEEIKKEIYFTDVIRILEYTDLFLSQNICNNGYDEDYIKELIDYINNESYYTLGEEAEENIKAVLDKYLVH